MLLTPPPASSLTISDVKTQQENLLKDLVETANDISICMSRNQNMIHCYDGAKFVKSHAPFDRYTYDQLKMNYPGNYKILLDEPLLCSDNPFMLLEFFVHPSQKAEREAIRSTYGKFTSYKNLKIRIVFISTYDNEEMDNNIYLSKESQLNHDIVQFDLINHMLNNTIYDMLAFNWTTNRCYFTPYIAKVPFHGFVNLTSIIDNYLYNNSIVHKHFVMVGVFSSNAPVRDPSSPYFLPDYLFRANKYPSYPADMLSIYSIDMIESLYEQSLRFLPLHYLNNVMIGQFLELQETHFTDIMKNVSLLRVAPNEMEKYIYSEKYGAADLIALFKNYYKSN